MLTFSVTLTDPLKLVEYGQSYYRTLHPFCRLVPLSITLIGSWLGFQVADICQHWIS